MDKMVEIARFQYPAEAYTLIELLKSEGIDCYLRNELTATLMSYLDVGGARVEILEKDLPRALKIMQEGGFIQPETTESTGSAPEAMHWMNRISFLSPLSITVKGIVLFFLVAGGIVLLTLFSYYFLNP